MNSLKPQSEFIQINGLHWLDELDNVFSREMPFISKLSWSNEVDDLAELEEIESRFVSFTKKISNFINKCTFTFKNFLF
jgi:hypothetical protein